RLGHPTECGRHLVRPRLAESDQHMADKQLQGPPRHVAGEPAGGVEYRQRERHRLAVDDRGERGRGQVHPHAGAGRPAQLHPPRTRGAPSAAPAPPTRRGPPPGAPNVRPALTPGTAWLVPPPSRRLTSPADSRSETVGQPPPRSTTSWSTAAASSSRLSCSQP